MKDLVLDGFVQSFATSRSLTHLQDGELFELFVSSSLFRKFHQWEVKEIDDIPLVGGSNDGGIDAIGILVNGRPARTKEDVEFFIDTLGRLDVELIFIQAKSSNKFNSSAIGQFTFGVQQFFSAVLGKQPQIVFNEEILQFIELTKFIFGQTIKMQENPQCYLYYATSGKWMNERDPAGRLEACKDHLQQLNIFSTVSPNAVDAEQLKTIYRDLEKSVDRQIEFSKTAVFPQIDGVEDAYIGLMPGDEFIKLVSNDDGDLNKELFFDNVRDFQGNNPVNKDIRNTLSDQLVRRNFPLLNNGVTITARSINRRGDIFTIRDFQIVNGCQTTHILFQNKHYIDSNIFIPVKLVATTDSQIVNEVIKATNRQTAVLPEALESLTSFHKELEDFYNIQERPRGPEDRMYYERRSKQFLMDNIDPKNIVTLTGQIKSFVGMFLNEPHSHPRYYGELLQSYNGKIFLKDHKPAPYYASGVGLLMVENWLNANRSERSVRHYKHQLLMLLRILIGGKEAPNLNNNKISSYSLKIVAVLRDPDQCSRECESAVDILNDCLNKFNAQNRQGLQRNPPHRLRAFTEYLVSTVHSISPNRGKTKMMDEPKEGMKESGKILWYDEWKRYGFIERAIGDKIFVHEGEMRAVPWHLRVSGSRVEYKVVKSNKYKDRLMASGVTVLVD